jgi:hypothetical protein
MGLTQTVYLVSSLPIAEVTAINNLQNIAAANLEIKRTLRISGDTIFFTPFEKLARETQYSVSFDVKLANGLTGTNDELKMTWKTVKATNLYVKATNTQSNGVMVDTFGPLQTVYIVPSAPIDSIDAIAAFDDGNGPAENTPDDNGAGVNLLKQRLRLSALGDTLFWTPVDTLKFGTRYGIKFNVTLKTGEQFGGSEITAIWKTKPGVALVSTNDMAAGSVHYRVFKCKGDSLVATFSKAIDTSKAFSVANFGAVGKLIYAWSADLKTVTIKDTSKLTVKTYAAIQDYSTSGNPQYSAITFSLTSLDGEQKVVTANADYAGVRPNLAIHTEDELVVVDASYLKVHNANKVAAADLAIDTVDSAANITITFNRAIDAAKVNVAARDAYFALVNVASPTTMLDYAISFTNGGKSVVINPAINMTAGATYNVKVKSVPDLTSGDDFSGVAASFVTTDGFKVKPMPRTQSVAALQSYIKADTNSVTGVGGKRVGASPAAAGTVYDGADLNTETSLKMNMSEVAWNVKHADSVAFYHYRARKVSRTGVATNWYETNANHAGSRISPAAWSTGFGSSVANSVNDSHQVAINLTAAQTVDGGSFIAALRSADKGADYSNNDHIFNDSARIEVQFRPVYDVNEDGDYLDAGEFGHWSNTLVYVDNIAPCDSDFVGAANCNILTEGGVGVVPVPVVLDRNTGAPGVGNYQITLTFPEDMDTVNKPSVSVKYGVILGAGETAITSTGTFIDARTYRFNLVLAAGIDYSDNAIYYSISVADMKDASGVTIQSSGDTGTAADGVLEATADDTEDQGSTNIQLLQML